MSRVLFNLVIPQEVQDMNLTGRQLTEMGFAVSKYADAATAAIVADNSADFGNIADITVTPGTRTITVLNGDTELPEGEWNLIGWNVIVGNATTAGNLRIGINDANRNLNLINCNCFYVNLHAFAGAQAFSVGFGTGGGAGAATRTDTQFGADAANSRGVNSYGSVHTVVGVGRPIRFADFIQSELIHQGGDGSMASSFGGRWIRSAFTKLNGGGFIDPYGTTAFDGAIFNQWQLVHGNTGPNQPSQLVLNQPQFSPNANPNTAQQTFLAANANQTVATSINNIIPGTTIDVRSLPIQLIGGPSLGTDATDALGNITRQGQGDAGFAGGILRGDRVVNWYSALNSFYALHDRYFSDGALTTGASGIRVRIDSNINPNTVTSTAGTLGGRAFSEIANFNTGTTSQIGQTNADGRLATFQWFDSSRPITNQTGYVDWFEWNDQTATDRTVWATNADGTSSPEGMMIMPWARAWIDNGTTNAAATDANLNIANNTISVGRRAFAWDVNIPQALVEYPDARVNIEVPNNSIVPATLVGTRVKAAYVTNNLPNTTLTSAFPVTPQAVSLNDIDNAFRERWFSFGADHTPDEDTTTTANNYSLTLDPTLSEPYGVAETGGEAIITVRANGIDATDGDLFDSRRFDIVDLGNTDSTGVNTVRNQNITAVTINNPRIGNTLESACFDNCTISGTLRVVGNQDGFSSNNYFFNLTDVSGIDLVQLPYTAPGSTTPETTGVTIIRGRVFDPDLNGPGMGGIRALRESDFNSVTDDTTGRLPAGTGSGTFSFEAPPVQLTIRPDVTEQDLQARGGFWRVTDVNGNILTQGNSSVGITSTTTLEDVTYSFTSASQDIRAYYQPGATPGGYVANYGFTQVASSAQTRDREFVVTPVDYTALAADTVNDRSGSVDVQIVNPGASQTLDVIVTTSTDLSNIDSQEVAIAILNDVNYINTVTRRGFTGDERILQLLQPFTTQYNGGLMDDPASTTSNPLPQIPVRPVINLYVAGTTGYGIASTAGHRSVPTTGNSRFANTTIIQVIAPVSDIVVAVESSRRLREIDNKTSWMVTDGAATGAQTTGGRLVGLRPKRADYGPDNDYTTNT